YSSTSLPHLSTLFPYTTLFRSNMIQQISMIFSTPDTLVDFYAFMDLPEEKSVGSLPIEKRLDNEYELEVSGLSFAYPDTTEEVRSEEHTSELQSRFDLVCRLLL